MSSISGGVIQYDHPRRKSMRKPGIKSKADRGEDSRKGLYLKTFFMLDLVIENLLAKTNDESLQPVRCKTEINEAVNKG
jgi:hypothetical protein